MLCKLCLQESQVENSHIIPEFCFKPLYDEKHRAIQIESESPRKTLIQKGIREKLLCRSCEQKISIWEKYFSEIWMIDNLYPDDFEESIRWLSGLDYKKLKLFHLSLLWRASVSKEKFFQGISIGPHEEKIRKLLNSEEPGLPSQYPVTCTAFLRNNRLVYGIILEPNLSRYNGTYIACLHYAGCMWSFLLSSQENIDMSLNQNGEMPILFRDYLENKFLVEFIKNRDKSSQNKTA